MRVAMCAVGEYDRAAAKMGSCWLVGRSVVVEKSVVATVAYVCVCVCVPELVGAGRRVEYYYGAGRQAGRQSPSKQASRQAKQQASSERKRVREWTKGILWLGIVAQSRMCV